MNKKLLITFKILFSTGLFVLIINSLDFSGTIKLLKTTNLNFFFVAMLIIALQIIIANIRWQIVLNNFKFKLSYMATLRYLWIGLFFNQALPSSIGGDALRGYYLSRSGSNLKNSALGVLLDRFFGFIGLVALVLIVIPLLFSRLDGLAAQWEIIFVIVGMLSVLSVVFILDLLPYDFSNWKIIRGLYALSFEARKMFFSITPGIILLLLSISIHVFSIIAVLILSEGLELEISWLGIVLVVPLATLFMLIPISIAGWGVREGVMIVGLGYLNVLPEQALALSILYGLLMLITALPGGIIWLFSSQPNKQEI